MPTRFEISNPALDRMLHIGNIDPGCDGSLSQTKPDGRRERFHFFCNEDNSATVLQQSVDYFIEYADSIIPIETDEMETIAELGQGESYEWVMKTDSAPTEFRVRLTHE